MKNFQFNRFINTLRWQLTERRSYLTFAAAGFIAIAIPTLVVPLLTGAFFGGTYPQYAESVSTLMLIAYGWYMVTCGSLIVSELGNKRNRISAFMLPASRLEKFVARYLILTIGLPLAAGIGYAAGDLLQMAANQVVFGYCRSSVAIFVVTLHDMLPRLSLSFGDTLLALELMVWFPHSLFLIAGTLFRRHAWVLSNLLMFVLSTLLSTAVLWGAKALFYSLAPDGIYSVGVITAPWAIVLYMVALAAVIAFNYWVAYRIYSRMQAVNNKWFNL